MRSVPAAAAAAVALLQDGASLTRREAYAVNARHHKRHNEHLQLAAVQALLDALDEQANLLPGQRRHLLATAPNLDALRCQLAPRCNGRPHRWCSYKKGLCDCEAFGPPQSPNVGSSREQEPAERVPQLLFLDSEFTPLRIAAVDEAGFLRIDALLPDKKAFPMLPGVLACDRPSLRIMSVAEAASLVEGMLTAGTVVVGHTIHHDLARLRVDPHAGRVVDIALMAGARCGEEDHSIRSLASLASEILGEVIHARGRRHCAIQDAEVARRLYYRLVDGSLNGTAP